MYFWNFIRWTHSDLIFDSPHLEASMEKLSEAVRRFAELNNNKNKAHFQEGRLCYKYLNVVA